MKWNLWMKRLGIAGAIFCGGVLIASGQAEAGYGVIAASLGSGSGLLFKD